MKFDRFKLFPDLQTCMNRKEFSRWEQAFKMKDGRGDDHREWVQGVVACFATKLGIEYSQAVQLVKTGGYTSHVRSIFYKKGAAFMHLAGKSQVDDERHELNTKARHFNELANLEDQYLSVRIREAFQWALTLRHAKDPIPRMKSAEAA